MKPPQWIWPGFPVPAHILREVTPDARVRLWCGGEWRCESMERAEALLSTPLTWHFGYCHACYRAWLAPWTREQLRLGGFV